MHNASNEAKWYYQDSYVEYLIWLSWHVKLSIMLEFYLYFIGNLIKTIWHRVPITSLIHVIRRISIIWPSLLSSEWNWLCIKCSKNVLNKNMSSLCVSYTNCTLFIDNFLLNANSIVLKFGAISNIILSMGRALYEKFSFKFGQFALFIGMKFNIFSFWYVCSENLANYMMIVCFLCNISRIILKYNEYTRTIIWKYFRSQFEYDMNHIEIYTFLIFV